jgi:hypothetical protein
MVDYPSTLPLEAAQLCLEITKARAIQARKAEFGLASWNVQGYIQRVTLGMPALPGDPDPEVTIPQIEDTIYQLEEALYEAEENMQFTMYEDSATGEIEAQGEEERGNVMVILAVVGIVIQLVQAWRNKTESDIQGCDDGDCDGTCGA